MVFCGDGRRFNTCDSKTISQLDGIQRRQYDSIKVVRDALAEQRFDIQALEVGQHPPVDRHEYWIRYAEASFDWCGLLAMAR